MTSAKLELEISPDSIVRIADRIIIYINADDISRIEHIQVRTKGPFSDTWESTLHYPPWIFINDETKHDTISRASPV